MRIVIALGGNAMTGPDGSASVDAQQGAIASAAGPIADLVAAGHDVLLTHGNGPQVGNLLLKNELAAAVVPPVPLDWCGAQTQATIGMSMMNALETALAARGVARRTAALVSRTLVDASDPAFHQPTKPIGRHLSEEEARVLIDHGQDFVEVKGKGWRRVVPSPRPVECLDAPAADALLALGYVVVCSGGGGIPTVRRDDGTLAGVEAVIDKDSTAVIVAEHIGADALVIATDVDHAVTDWGSDHEAPIGEVTAARMRQIAHEQDFAEGSMGPKVEAVTSFAERTGGVGIITSLTQLLPAVEGRVGTRVRPD
ncbi:carbamate kinase [Nocardioides sp.]|uniref:carbamate kinase n=1 Tax=Nocardioides sp. TaxID=35761 RepID=UPI00273661E3|nr:carbamate kinase [Nocardioides sp.]MDP3890687.1 carbamate kinase [Nocardioides sp.]